VLRKETKQSKKEPRLVGDLVGSERVVWDGMIVGGTEEIDCRKLRREMKEFHGLFGGLIDRQRKMLEI
jgi:hypothetical protein